jgi:hypothetical protein
VFCVLDGFGEELVEGSFVQAFKCSSDQRLLSLNADVP